MPFSSLQTAHSSFGVAPCIVARAVTPLSGRECTKKLFWLLHTLLHIFSTCQHRCKLLLLVLLIFVCIARRFHWTEALEVRSTPKSLIFEQNPICHIRSFWQCILNAEDFPLFHMDLVASWWCDVWLYVWEMKRGNFYSSQTETVAAKLLPAKALICWCVFQQQKPNDESSELKSQAQQWPFFPASRCFLSHNSLWECLEWTVMLGQPCASGEAPERNWKKHTKGWIREERGQQRWCRKHGHFSGLKRFWYLGPWNTMEMTSQASRGLRRWWRIRQIKACADCPKPLLQA